MIGKCLFKIVLKITLAFKQDYMVNPCDRILNLLNHEICCDFTHMIVTDRINLDSDTMPLCGAI